MSATSQAKQYSTIKYSLSIIETLYILVLLAAFLYSGLSKGLADKIPRVTQNHYLVIAVYLLVISLGYYFLNLPFNFYHSYVLEHKFSLSNQKIKHWISDEAKSGIISFIIVFILLQAFYYVLRHYPGTWWLVISLFWVFFTLILARLTPTIIVPLFFKYKRLHDETLRSRIMNLADKMEVKVFDCFEIDFSKKTLKANAAFMGWGKTRRIVLADTLKDKYTYDEIEVILAHEFAHYKLKHLLKLILVNSLVTFLTFYLIFLTNSRILGMFGLGSLSDIAALPVVFLYFLLLGIISQPLNNFISRKFEKNADALALRITGLKDAFISMMEKLANQNLADRNPHPVIKFYFFDHPPIDERINMAKAFKQ